MLAVAGLGILLTVPVGLKAATLASTGVSLTVTSNADAVDANPGNGACATSSGVCTLRAAIQETNALAGADTIVLPSGTYELAIPPLNQNLADVGDLDITDSLTISGAGAGTTVVDGGTPAAGAPLQVRGLDRLFEVLAVDGAVAFDGLTFSDGYAAEYGGAILNSGTAAIVVSDSTFSGNVAGKTGGAIDNHLAGRVELRDSSLVNNYATESGSALNNNRDGTVAIANSTILSNSPESVGLDPALAGAGAVSNNAELDAIGTIAITGGQISNNHSTGARSGAAVSNDGAGTVVVAGTTFAKNRSEVDGGAIVNGAGDVTVTGATFTENVADNGGAISNGTKDGRLTVSGSTFSLNSASARGGAIASGGTGSLEVSDSTFSKNTAESWGGAIVSDDKGSVTIRSSTFTENAGLNGGGFGNEGDGPVLVENSTFTKNSAVVTSVLASGEGGGLHSNSAGELVVEGGVFTENRARNGGGLGNEGGGQLTITGTRFSGNRAEEKGGGILIQSGTVRMVDIDVVGNFADAAVEAGGGIAYEGDKLVSVGEAAAIENSRIVDNRAKGQGGGIDSRGDGPLDLLTTTVAGNTAVMGGGIHHVGDAPLDIARSTLSGNVAESGGGLFTDGDGETSLLNTTVSGNRAGQFGGGLLVSSRLNIKNSTVASNSAAQGGGINNGGGDFVGDGTVFLANTIVANSPTGGNCQGTMTSLGGNVDSGNTCLFIELSDQPGTDPRLGPLGDNGGPTRTHALLADSPAQEKAVCTDAEPCPSLDQRGVERPIFARVDAGAYESELTPPGGGTGGDPQPCTGRTERPVPADYDSWIAEGTPASNFGNDSILKVKSLSGGNQRALVHFALPAIPPGCDLVAASLRLQSSSATDGRTLEVLRLDEAWSEAGVTWADQPDPNGDPATAQSGVGLREWNVLSQTLEMYELGDHGFLIQDSAEGESGEQSLHATEKGADNPPVLVLVFDSPGAPAPGDECATTPQSLFADRDAWVSQGSPTNNFGSDSSLKVKSQTGANARALVRFPLPTLPARCTGIASATLRVDAASAKEGRTLDVRRIGSDWTELGVTWNNQPGTVGAAASVPSFDGVLEWGVTAQVVDMYLSANHGFLLRDAEENSVGEEQTLNGRLKVNDGPPELVLVFDDSTPDTTIDQAPPATVAGSQATFAFSSDSGTAFECSLDSAPFTACSSPLTLTGLGESTHSFQVRAKRPIRAVDPTPATHSWKVAIPPETTVSGPSSPSASTSATLRFTADDAAATFECSLDGAAYETCVSPVELTDLADGAHTFGVRATDALDNVELEPATHSWTVADPPETTIAATPAALSRDGSPEFGFGADETGSTFECRLDGGAWLGCSSPHSYLGLADGGHTFEVRATDAAQNTDPDPASYAWTIDTAAPAATIVSGPAALTNDATPSFAFGSEAGASFECALGATLAPCTSPFEVTTPLADGPYTFRVRATDAAGNAGEAASLTFTLDTLGPVATIDSGPSGPTNDATPTFTFSSEEGASFACALGGDYAPCSSPYVVIEPLADGEYAFQVRAIDAAGNTGDAASLSFTVDTEGPATTIGSGPSGLTNDSTPAFGFSAEDGATFECALDSTFAPCESPYEVETALADGSHTFGVRATDTVGNIGDIAGVTFVVDTEGPATTIESGPSGLTNDSTPIFAFSSEEGASFSCSLGGTFAPCASPYDVTEPLADDTYFFLVQAKDPAGNAGAVASTAFTVDTQGPIVSLAGPSGLTGDSTPAFTFDSEAGATLECALDGGFASCESPVEVTEALADGAHTFQVRATDLAGNTGPVASTSFTVDTQGPTTSIDSGPAGLTNDATPSFAFTSEEGATFSCALGAAFAPCVSPYDVTTPLADGSYTFEVRATDTVGNAGGAASVTFTIDTLGPAVSVDGPSGLTADSTPTFTFASEEDASFACALGGVLAPCESPYAVTTPLADGDYVFRVQATDLAGNPGEVASLELTVDTQGPATAIGSGPSGLTTDRTPTFTFASEEGATFACRVAGAFAACESPYAVTTPLADGSYTFEVEATDAVGNTGDVASRSFTVDTQGPATTITAGPAGLTSDATPSFELASETGATLACRIDTAAFAPCQSPYQVRDALSEGPHTFEARATDAAGNTGEVAGRSFTVDTQGPAVTLLGPSGLTNDSTPTFTFSASDAVGFRCSLGGESAACTSPYEVADALTDGDYRFAVTATDAAGNAGDEAALEFTVDTGTPGMTILTGPDDPTTARSARFTFSADDAGASFQCKLDTGEYAACVSGVTYEGPLSLGEHVFQVKAGDAAGNEGAPASYAWTIEAPDTTAPTVSIASGPDNPTTARSAQFTFSADDPGASFQCQLDTADYGPCASGVSYASLALGEHLFQVKASDGAGNEGAPASYTWTIEAPDTTAPAVSIASRPDNPTTARSAQFTFSADESGASFQCKLDAVDYAACASGIAYAGPLALGDHLFQVRASDAAGNEGAPASYAWTIEAPDTTAPTVTIGSGPDDPTTATSAQFAFSADDPGARFQCKLDTGDYGPCASGVSYASLALGEHLFQVKASDAAGNEGAPASYAWTIEAADTTAPLVTIGIGPDNPTTARSAQFTFSADDPGASFQCRLDTGVFVSCTSGITYEGPLSLGDHLFEVKASDAALNEGAPATYAWRVHSPDLTAPAVTIGTGPDNPTTARSAQFTFSADDPGASFQCRLDTADYAPCASGIAYEGPLDLGEHLFHVKASDAAGNEGAPASYAWTIEAVAPPPDTTAPVVTITSGPASGTATTATFQFSANEPATFHCSLDGGPFSSCSSGASYSGLAAGPHTFQVQGADAAGNVGTANWSWTVSATPPPPSCTPQTITVSPNADTWLLESSPTSNYGRDSVIKVDTKAGANARALLRFALPTAPAGCAVRDAKLRLHAGSYKSGRTLHAVLVASSWSHTGVTWATQPPASGGAPAAAPSGAGYVEWAVASQLAGVTGQASFLVKDASEGGEGVEQAFHSLEKAPDSPPQLVITFG